MERQNTSWIMDPYNPTGLLPQVHKPTVYRYDGLELDSKGCE